MPSKFLKKNFCPSIFMYCEQNTLIAKTLSEQFMETEQ